LAKVSSWERDGAVGGVMMFAEVPWVMPKR
jgi:hypothetical protein